MVERPKRSGTRNRRSSIGDTFGQANAGWKHRADGQSNVNRLNSGPPPKAGGARLKRFCLPKGPTQKEGVQKEVCGHNQATEVHALTVCWCCRAPIASLQKPEYKSGLAAKIVTGSLDWSRLHPADRPSSAHSLSREPPAAWRPRRRKVNRMLAKVCNEAEQR